MKSIDERFSNLNTVKEEIADLHRKVAEAESAVMQANAEIESIITNARNALASAKSDLQYFAKVI